MNLKLIQELRVVREPNNIEVKEKYETDNIIARLLRHNFAIQCS